MFGSLAPSNVEGDTDGCGTQLEEEFSLPGTNDCRILGRVRVRATARPVTEPTTDDAKELVGRSSFAFPKGLSISVIGRATS